MTNANWLRSSERGLVDAAPEAGLVEAVLEGGPVDIPPAARVCLAPYDARKIKLPRNGGYEHFERDTEPSPDDEGKRVVFSWRIRTRIAE